MKQLSLLPAHPDPFRVEGPAIVCFSGGRTRRRFGSCATLGSAGASGYRPYVKGKQALLPNPAQRFCTSELKIKTAWRFMRSLGHDDYESYVGIRADEPRRTLCFMKARSKVVEIMQKTTAHDRFWIEAEKLTGQTFRLDRSYQKLREEIDAGTLRPGPGDDVAGDCFCGPGD